MLPKAVAARPERARHAPLPFPTTPRSEVAYVSAVIEPGVGVLTKLERQAKACADHGIGIDFYSLGRGTQADAAAYPNLRMVHVDARNVFGFRRQQAKLLADLLERYEHLVLRYPLWDPVFHALIPHKDRILLELHTNYLAELGSQRSWRFITEALFGRWVCEFGALIGVAPEVLDGEVARSRFRGPTAVIPNSIDVAAFAVEDAPLLDPFDRLRFVMVASSFYPWHGLEKVLAALESAEQPLPFDLHLVGQLSPQQHEQASRIEGVVIHGMLASAELKAVYRSSHAGLTCFNLASKGMKTSVPLKAREYLASGLPIVGGYLDAALPAEFPYQLCLEEFDVGAATAYVRELSGVSRLAIQREATPYIDSQVASQRLLDLCRSL